jgi:hypothetical protein
VNDTERITELETMVSKLIERVKLHAHRINHPETEIERPALSRGGR